MMRGSNLSIRDAVGICVAATAGLLLAGGCTLLGLGIGAAADSGKPKAGIVPGWEWTTIKPGTPVVVRLTDSAEVKGTFTKITRLSAVSYTRQYTQWKAGDSSMALLPAPGEELVLRLRSGEQVRGRLTGYDQRLVAAVRTPYVWIVPMGDTTSKPVSLDSVLQMVDQAGKTIDSSGLDALAGRRDLPSLSAISLRTDQFIWPDISFDRIAQISYPQRHGAEMGMLIGFGIDMAIVAIVVLSSMESNGESESDGGGGYVDNGSCPIVCSFDGKRYVRDAEVLTGSIFQGAQRTDWDNLDSLQETNGFYDLKVINERDETEYLDELKLLVVDHAAGTQVVPSFSGELCALRNLESPVAATDYSRSNVLDLVTAKDNQVWVSNPFGRNPEDTSQVRDGLVLEFRKPADTDSVTLVFNVQNTVWGAYLQTQFVKLFGRDLDKWYNQMNTSPEARERLQQVMIREGMLLVHLWDGKEWRPTGHVWEVGPALARDVAVRLPLGGIPGDVLRVRLESTAGLWMINSVRATYEASASMLVTELSLREAEDCHGIDLRRTLQAADGDYYEMPTTKDWAELTFIAPVRKLNSERSFILKSTGYYSIHTPGTGEPQTELVQRMMAEPGAFGQHGLRLLNGYVKDALAERDQKTPHQPGL